MAQDLQRPFRLPADAVEVILVRHGAAVEDGPVTLTAGHADHALSDLGREQAERVADRLAREAPTSLFVSSLQRTAQTAAPLAGRLGVEPAVVPELREVHLGEWETDHGFARRVAQRDPAIRELLKQERWDVAPGAEDPDAFAARVAGGMKAILAQVPLGSTTAAFTHAGVIAEICRQTTGSRAFAFLGAENTAITRIVARGGRLRLRSFNDTEHLS